MMPDNLQEIVPMHTITASEASNSYVILPRGAKGAPLTARVQYMLANQASGSGVWTFTAQASYDKGGTWATVATGAAITLTTVYQDGEQLLAFSPTTLADSGQIWVQVLATLSGSGVTPTIAYRADLLGGPF
jgi:hypothetical protein